MKIKCPHCARSFDSPPVCHWQLPTKKRLPLPERLRRHYNKLRRMRDTSWRGTIPGWKCTENDVLVLDRELAIKTILDREYGMLHVKHFIKGHPDYPGFRGWDKPKRRGKKT